MDYNSQLVLGLGEIGKSLKKVLEEYYKVDGKDSTASMGLNSQYDILHICYPWSDKFIDNTIKYIIEYDPKLVIIHSTVAVGTTKYINKISNHSPELTEGKDLSNYEDICVHSPIRGKHPELAEGIKTFVKFIGGDDSDRAEETIRLLTTANIKCYRCVDSKTTELLKILSTTYYGWNIVFEKEIKKICDDYGVSFRDVYTISNQTYNDGYDILLNDTKFHRPVLEHMKGEIGGHCVIPNCKLLDNDITKFILDKNEGYKLNK